MRAPWRELNESLEARSAWQEAVMVGVSVAIAVALIDVVRGRSLGGIAVVAAVALVGSALGIWIARPVRTRRRARRNSSN